MPPPSDSENNFDENMFWISKIYIFLQYSTLYVWVCVNVCECVHVNGVCACVCECKCVCVSVCVGQSFQTWTRLTFNSRFSWLSISQKLGLQVCTTTLTLWHNIYWKTRRIKLNYTCEWQAVSMVLLIWQKICFVCEIIYRGKIIFIKRWRHPKQAFG